MPFPDNFSDELKLHIFQYLSAKELIKIGRVCKDWKRLSVDKTLWKNTFNVGTSNYSAPQSGSFWKINGKTQNSPFPILVETRFLYFLYTLISLSPIELFNYIKELLNISPDHEDTIQEEQLKIIITNSTLVQKLATLDANEIIKNIEPLPNPFENQWLHIRVKKFIEALLTVPEFSQKISIDIAIKLGRNSISPEFLLKGNEKRFSSDDIYRILKYYSEESPYPSMGEEVLKLLENSIFFEKVGNEGFRNIVVTSPFAEPLLKKPNLLKKLPCEDILIIMEILFDMSDEASHNLDFISPDEIIMKSIEVFRKYELILEQRTDYSEEIAKKVVSLSQSFEKLIQDLNEIFARLDQNRVKIEEEFEVESDPETEISEDSPSRFTL